MLEATVPTIAPPTTEPAASQPTEAPENEEEDEMADESERQAEAEDETEVEQPVAMTPALPRSAWKFSQKYHFSLKYDDNIFISSSHKQGDAIFTIGATYGLTWGDSAERTESYLSVEYSPSGIFLADHSGYNGYEQNAAIIGQWRVSRLTLGAQARIQFLTGGDTDIGNRADRRLYDVELTAKYDLSDRTSVESDLTSNIADYQQYHSSMELAEHTWVDYKLFPKTKVGLGATFGYAESGGGPTQTFEQVQVRVNSNTMGKLAFRAAAGVELRQLGRGGGQQISPVFDLDASYNVFDGTEITIGASRHTSSSAAVRSENYTTDEVTARLRQRLFQRFYVVLDGGYENADYSAVGGAHNQARHDRYLFFRPGLSFPINDRWNVDFTYEYRRNESSEKYYSFENKIMTLQTTIAF